MQIAITGATSGIGQVIADYYRDNGDYVTNFSTSNGYNIAHERDRAKIIQESREHDIFVNVAYNNYDRSQLLLLQAICNEWFNDTNRMIINISSKYTHDDNAYCRSKRELDDYCRQFEWLDGVHVVNLKPGLIDTPRVKHISGHKTPPDYLVSVIHYLMTTRSLFRTYSMTFAR